MNLEEYKKTWQKPLQQATICLLIRGDEVLLGMKKRGLGAGRWNGFGGKLNAGESVEEAAVREAWEEAGVRIKQMKKFGVINYYFTDMTKAEKYNQQVHIFVVTSWEGSPTESEEMLPKWFKKGELPFESMWSGDDYWMPKVLAGEYVNIDILHGDGENVVEIRPNKHLRSTA